MPVLQGTDIADLVQSVVNDKGALKMTDIMSDYQDTIFFKRMVRKGKMDFDSGGGTEFEWNLITNTNGSARGVGLYYTANVGPVDVMAAGKMGYRHMTWNWAIDGREISMNGNARKVYSLIQVRRITAFGDGVKYCERVGWRCPNATTNLVDFMGIPYWIVKSNTAATAANNDGFNGLAPSGYTLVGNINPTTQTRWRNYATQYTAVTKDDLIRKMERASDYTDFMPLVDDAPPSYNTGNDYGYYTTYSVRQTMKDILEAQNDNLGFDLDPAQGKLVYRRSPIVWVKELDQDTTNPLYGINWGVFKFKGLSGWWLRETHKASLDNQPTVAATHTDSSVNSYCTDRRRNFVLATDTTMPA